MTTFLGKPVTLLGTKRNVGEKAPDFEAVTNDLQAVRLSSYPESVKVISAVPSLDTGVCDMQTRTFYQMFAAEKDVLFLTVSVDLPFAQARWCGQEGLKQVKTVSDHRELDFGMQYGLVMAEWRLLGRAVFVIGRDGNITYCEYVSEVTDHLDYKAAESALRTTLAS